MTMYAYLKCAHSVDHYSMYMNRHAQFEELKQHMFVGEIE